MILRRIKLIKNVGKFYNCQSPGTEFGRETIIYGKNGDGKSTLTAIFRSLATNNATILKGRKSFGSTDNKKIELVFENSGTNQEFIFHNQSWNHPYNKILIFDSQFIHENVYEGESVDENHKSNLHRVIIGATGADLVREIEEAIEKIKALEQKKKELTSEYKGSTFGNSFTIEVFINVPQDPQIDEKIRAKEKEIDFVRQLSRPGSINIIAINTENLRTILGQGFKSAHEDAELQLIAHIENHWKDKGHPKTFIRDGLTLIYHPNELDESTCPFCGQSLAPVKALIECYRQYFDSAYKKFREALVQEIEIFSKINPEVIISAAEAIVSSWQQFLGEDYSKQIIDSLAKLKIEIVKSKGMFSLECNKKIHDLNHDVEFLQLDIFIKSFSEFLDLVKTFNQDVQLYISSHSEKSEEILKQEIGKLRTIKSRHTEKWIKYCKEYSDGEFNVGQAKTQRDQKIEALSIYAQETFTKHQTTINRFLGEMGVDFKIANLCELRDLRRTPGIFCGYEIEFFSRDRIPLHDFEGKPSVKNCLSQGDKGALAFAFFLSTIAHADALGDKIIVFDDPVSSFDGERKRKTVHLLLDVSSLAGDRPAQLIIMTHETQFLGVLYNTSTNPDTRFIKIEPDGVTPEGRKKSRIAYCDVLEEFLQAKEIAQLKGIYKFSKNNEIIPEEVRGDCRKVVEAVFKIKYYLELEEEINQKKSVRAFLEKLCGLNLPNYDSNKRNRLARLFDDLHVPHHSGITRNPVESSAGDLRSILRDTLRELREL